MTRRSLLLLVLVLVAAAPARGQDIDDFVKGWIDAQHVPAAAIAVVKDGVLIKAEGYGLANVENRVPARPDTVFKIGSLSKQFIATGIMLLVQDGRIAVDDKISKHLDGTPASWDAITLRHLLTHTSGLVREAPGFDIYKRQPDIDVIKTAYQVALASAPGEKYAYSNLGYFVLAEVISRASGKSWSDFLAERVFAPLGLTATRVTSLTDIVPNRASGYAWRAGQLQNEDDWPAVRPSGAFLSTVLDLAKWETGAAGRPDPEGVDQARDVDAGAAERWSNVPLWIRLAARRLASRCQGTDWCSNDPARRIDERIPCRLCTVARSSSDGDRPDQSDRRKLRRPGGEHCHQVRAATENQPRDCQVRRLQLSRHVHPFAGRSRGACCVGTWAG